MLKTLLTPGVSEALIAANPKTEVHIGPCIFPIYEEVP